jgi:predicted nucleic acid-binding protein
LHCALQGKARLLITGDKDLGALKKNYSFEILEPRAAWTKIMGHRS